VIDRIDLARVRGALSTKLVGRVLHHDDATPSTNDRVFEDPLAPDGYAAVAEAQTKGRGRLGRDWHSPPSRGILVSILLRPTLPRAEHAAFSVLPAVAAAEAIEKLLELPVQLKWPNDLMHDGCKLGGVLVESRLDVSGDRLACGIGLNANHTLADLPAAARRPATSLRLILGHPIDRDALLAAVLNALEPRYAQLQAGRTAGLEGAWRDRTGLVGRKVLLQAGATTYRGRVESLGLSGIALRDAAGALHQLRGEHTSLVEIDP